MKITKKLFTCLLLPLFLCTAPAEDEKDDCNFFVRRVEGSIIDWNWHYRADIIVPHVADTRFLDPYKEVYKKHLHEFVERYYPKKSYVLGELEQRIDTVFRHLVSYYSTLELYGQVCYGVTPETPEKDIPKAYRNYIEIIQNECRYLCMLILKHCEWGGGDSAMIGSDEHYEEIEKWVQKNLAPIPHLPSPPKDTRRSRVRDALSENAMTQLALNFSIFATDQLLIFETFSYTNLVVRMHDNQICPLREKSGISKKFDTEEEYELARALVIRQQDEWSRLIHYCLSKVFLTDCFGVYGSGDGVVMTDLIERQYALINYFSGGLIYPEAEVKKKSKRKRKKR